MTFTFIPGGTTDVVREVDFLVIGLDQFGMPAQEVVRVRTRKNPSSQITRKCYTGWYVPSYLRQENVQRQDRYRWGQGRSRIDDTIQDLHPEMDPGARPHNSWRIPLPARCRSADQIKAVQLLKQGTILQPNVLPDVMTIDLEAQSIEIILDTPDEVEFRVILDPAGTVV